MEKLKALQDRIINRVNINLREQSFDTKPYIKGLIPFNRFNRFYAFYGVTSQHPLHFHFNNASLAGSYFLGKCAVDHSILYKCDIRGDELKAEGDIFREGNAKIPVYNDEVIKIKDSCLVKTLVHNYSHDPENLEEFTIQNTVSMHYANIHGSPVEGSFLGPFSTIDLTTVHDCVIGPYAYVMANEVAHKTIAPGLIWLHSVNDFDFKYRFPAGVLKKYIDMKPGQKPGGILMDIARKRKADFEKVFNLIQSNEPVPAAEGAYVSRYAVVKGKTEIGENVLVAQRAYLEDAWLGKGANAQENCDIINSRLEKFNVTAHGAKLIHVHLGPGVFVGFNSFLRGSQGCLLKIGGESIVMPHTIIDLKEPVEIPAGHLVWGYIKNRHDLKQHTISLEKFSGIKKSKQLGSLHFRGNGELFVRAFKERIDHILEANGAYYNGISQKGHAQKSRHIAYNTIQPYPDGPLKGLYPVIKISPPFLKTTSLTC